MGQRQVHVVAAEENVIADRDARQNKLAGLLGHGDQRQVGGTAADVADQHRVADLDLVAPAVLARVDPRIERRLRFL